MWVLDGSYVETSIDMKVVDADMGSVVAVAGPFAEGVDEMVADLDDSPVVAFVSCPLNIGIWHTVVMISPVILPLLPSLHLR